MTGSGSLRLIPNSDGAYDLLIEYGRFDAEFGTDFFSKDRFSKSGISGFIKKNAQNIKISSVRILAAGTLLAVIPAASFLSANALEDGAKYAMAYLYGGDAQRQIEYVARTNNALQTVSPSWFDLNADGSLKLNPVSKTLVDRMRAGNIKVVPFLSNHWDRAAGVNALKNADLLSTQIAHHISLYGLDGVNVDIENVTESQRGQYAEFVRLLRLKIPARKEVSVAVAANPNGWKTGWHGSYDYAALAKNADHLMMMTYDEHYEGGPSGPVAGIGFVENSIKYALSQTTADKLVVGLPFYGRIWSVNNNSVMGKGIAIDTINSMIKDYKAAVTFDAASQSPKAEFEIKTGDKQYVVGGKPLLPGKYVVWFEDSRSLQAKLSLVRKYDLKGAGSWALGQEDASIWNDYGVWLNGGNPAKDADGKAQSKPSVIESAVYTVVAGDSLWKISQKFGMTVDNLKAYNKLTSDVIKIGQKLAIPPSAPRQ